MDRLRLPASGKSTADADASADAATLTPASTSGYRLKLIDFGLSNVYDGGHLLKTACGSPCYAGEASCGAGRLLRCHAATAQLQRPLIVSCSARAVAAPALPR